MIIFYEIAFCDYVSVTNIRTHILDANKINLQYEIYIKIIVSDDGSNFYTVRKCSTVFFPLMYCLQNPFHPDFFFILDIAFKKQKKKTVQYMTSERTLVMHQIFLLCKSFKAGMWCSCMTDYKISSIAFKVIQLQYSSLIL